jgi:hypothetical protein
MFGWRGLFWQASKQGGRTTYSTRAVNRKGSGRVGTVSRQVINPDQIKLFRRQRSTLSLVAKLENGEVTGRPLEREPYVRTPGHRSRARGTRHIRRSGGKVSKTDRKKQSTLPPIGRQPEHPTPPLSEKLQRKINFGPFESSSS